jgi:hypothetical protein
MFRDSTRKNLAQSRKERKGKTKEMQNVARLLLSFFPFFAALRETFSAKTS